MYICIDMSFTKLSFNLFSPVPEGCFLGDCYERVHHKIYRNAVKPLVVHGFIDMDNSHTYSKQHPSRAVHVVGISNNRVVVSRPN